MKRTIKRILYAVAAIVLAMVLFMGYGMYRVSKETSSLTPLESGKLTDDIYVIKDKYSNMFLIENNEKYIAVDAGVKPAKVSAELKKLAIDPSRVVAVFLTHTDSDHTGALSLFDNAVIYISKAEEKMIDGTINRMLFFKNKLNHPYQTIENYQEIVVNGSTVKGILTEGHTVGSMCYQVNERYLFTGDILGLYNGKIGPFSDFFNMDSEKALQTHQNIQGLDGVEYIFTAHNGYTDDYDAAF